MSWLREGDKEFHYADGWIHRWTGGDGTPKSNEAWDQRVREHVERHRQCASEGLEPTIKQGWHRYEDFPA